MAEQQEDSTSHRPSFVSFWKKGKELARGQGRKKEVTFVQAQVGGSGRAVNSKSSDTSLKSNTSASPEIKAAQRRAQVRRAQIQHRQRKVNYVKDLEQEVAKIRKQIEDINKERSVLRAENDGMRAQLRSRGPGEAGLLQQSTPPQLQNKQPMKEKEKGLCYLSEDMGFTMTMKLGYDEVLGAPCYMISRLSPSFSPSSLPTEEQTTTGGELVLPNSHHANNTIAPLFPPGATLPTPPRTATFDPGVGSAPGAAAGNTDIMTTDSSPVELRAQAGEIPELPVMTPSQIQAAINFILALEHICRDHFHSSSFSLSSATTRSLLPLYSCSGHTLMATSLALQSAPLSIFTTVRKTRLFPGSSVSIKPSRSEKLEWENSTLTLRNLYRLSRALDKDGKDEMEITPVQAWFEVVREYGLERVVEKIGDLKREIGHRKGVVRCPHLGAVVGREEWNAIVGEVMRR